MNNIKCSTKACGKPSIGYFTMPNYGLWLCKEHCMGTLFTTIDEARKDKTKEWLFDME